MIKPASFSFGSDPEIFFAKNGSIIGAEKVIPENGLVKTHAYTNHRVVLDGVQAELHPMVASVVSQHAMSIAHCFDAISTKLSKMTKDGIQVSFAQVVQVDAAELATLSDAARILGCMPSFNFYKARPIRVKADFPMRSAAGHIHLGLSAPIYKTWDPNPMDYRKALVPLLDILVGNTGVMLDRDPLARERRKLYGHAGEFRLPDHGLEYRTPSNFWLKGGYGIMELIFGLASTAVAILTTSLNEAEKGNDPESELAKLVDLKTFQSAIERNDAKLAWKNWQSIRPFMAAHVPENKGFPIHTGNLDKIDKFLDIAGQDKLTPFLPPDPVSHWVNLDPLKTNFPTLLTSVVG